MNRGLLLLLLLYTAQAKPCPPCSCEPLPGKLGWRIDCTSLGLKEMPRLSIDILTLELQNNSLTTVHPGTLDILRKVEKVDFSNNPWNCDCSILYFKMWLEDFHGASLANITCAGPASVKMTALSQLSGNDLEGCQKPPPISCLDFLWRDVPLIAIAILVLILASCTLHYSRILACRTTQQQHLSEVPLLQIHAMEDQKSK
ncbi:platelet glycoprotein IX-like [Heteronotia binoei]|uniref:platelet glycoprotein IX-like n=1 Tax=Heteronotia binoei TaxID=13085 RepID=UPI0029311CC5|nr:platelet glycoprotein IX-like [Heteronotia binoei]XP_060119602.1 platelet glycoprotein IX-like [Heteronotia binoei]